jgi:hypothetical protein
MKTINQHIYTLRTLIKNHSDDSYYTDEFLYSLLKSARSSLLEREAKKFTHFPESSYQTICMPLIVDNYHDCECLDYDSDCKVLKSRYDLPTLIQGRNKNLIKIKTIEGDNIDHIVDSAQFKHNKYSKTKKKSILYTIDNNRIILFGTTKLKVIIIQAVFENPEDLANISYCNVIGEESDQTCYSVAEDPFPMKQSLDTTMYEEVLNLLKVPISLPEDLTNDAISQNG